MTNITKTAKETLTELHWLAKFTNDKYSSTKFAGSASLYIFFKKAAICIHLFVVSYLQIIK